MLVALEGAHGLLLLLSQLVLVLVMTENVYLCIVGSVSVHHRLVNSTIDRVPPAKTKKLAKIL